MIMSKLNIIIEKAEHNYSAFIKEIDGVVATGSSIDEIKTNILEAIEVLIESYKDCTEEIPEVLSREYDVEFSLDTQSFLNIYSEIFTKSGLERLTGINQKQLWHYAKGKTKPRPAQKMKIESALHKLGEELISLHF